MCATYSPNSQNEILNRIESYVEKGDFSFAIEEYKKMINTSQTTFTILNNLADLYMKQGKIPYVLKLLYYTIENYCKNGFTHRAIALYKKIHRLDPTNPSIPLIIGDLYAKLKLNAEAKKWYFSTLNFYKGFDFIEKRLEICKKIVTLEGEFPTLSLQLAEELQKEGFTCASFELYIEIGKDAISKNFLQSAIASYEKALFLDSSSKPTIKALALAYTQNNNSEKAVNLLQNAIEKMPNDVSLIRTLGYVYLSVNRLEEAENVFNVLFSISNLSYDCLLSVANRYLESKNYSQALDIVDKCLEILIERRQEIKAIKLLEGLLTSNPNDLEAMERLITIYRQIKNFELLAVILEKYAQETLKRNLKERAEKALNELIMLKPNDNTYLQQLRLLTSSSVENGNIDKEVNMVSIQEVFSLDNNEGKGSEKSIKEAEIEISLEEDFSEPVYLEALDDPVEMCNKDFSDEKTFYIKEEPDNNTIYQYLQDKEKELYSYNLELPSDMFWALSNNEKPAVLVPEEVLFTEGKTLDQIEAVSFPALDKVLKREWKRAMRNLKPISLVLIEIPCLVSSQRKDLGSCVNNLAKALSKDLKRPGDVVALCNHKYLAVILPETEEMGANIVANRLISNTETLKGTSFATSTSVPKIGSLPNFWVELLKGELLTKKRNSKDIQCLNQFC